jgi:hypothetical protein
MVGALALSQMLTLYTAPVVYASMPSLRQLRQQLGEDVGVIACGGKEVTARKLLENQQNLISRAP